MIYKIYILSVLTSFAFNQLQGLPPLEEPAECTAQDVREMITDGLTDEVIYQLCFK